MNFEKFLRTSFVTEHLRRLLLNISNLFCNLRLKSSSAIGIWNQNFQQHNFIELSCQLLWGTTLLRNNLSVTISYLYNIMLSHTLVWHTVSLSAALWLDLIYSSFNIASVVLGLNYPLLLVIVHFLLLKMFFQFSFINYDFEISFKKALPLKRLKLFVKVWVNMKSYYDLLFFSVVCSSFKGFKWTIPKLKDSQKIAGICQTPKK